MWISRRDSVEDYRPRPMRVAICWFTDGPTIRLAVRRRSTYRVGGGLAEDGSGDQNGITFRCKAGEQSCTQVARRVGIIPR